MPAPAVILAAVTLITGLIGTFSGTGVGIHSAIQSEKAVDLGQDAVDQGEDNLRAALDALNKSKEALEKVSYV